MSDSWNVLVVDDEPDVHQITRLALKHKRWRKKGFQLEFASSAAEARQVLSERAPDHFHVAMIDVVMETDDAGLRLCRDVREDHPNSLRIILRTGQPGVAPEEVVLNDYDIDFYLSKSEATPDKLHTVIRSCLRSSQDISTLLAFSKQLQSFTRALQSVSSLDDLLIFMREGLGFLELKHGAAATLFYYDVNKKGHDAALGSGRPTSVEAETIYKTITQLHESGNITGLQPGQEIGLPAQSFVIPFESRLDGSGDEGPTVGAGGLFVEFDSDSANEKTTSDFHSDANLFIENWRIAYAALMLQERLARERMLREQMYYERLQSIATMVAGVAHEMNTPLGVANTANTMIVGLAEKVTSPDTPPDLQREIIEDLKESCELLSKNLHRAQALIKSFKQLSGSQLADVRTECNVLEVVSDCVRTMSPQLRKQKVEVMLSPDEDPSFLWDGYPGHLAQVIINFLQNALRYAYPEGGGKVDIRILTKESGGERSYRIDFEDHGGGVAPEILSRIFEPFVTSGRKQGGTGLGLAITHNIVTNLLGGTIAVNSVTGTGTTFTIEFPLRAPDEGEK